MLRENKTATIMFIRDTTAYGFKCYRHTWHKYYGDLAINSGILGDKGKTHSENQKN